MVSSRDTLDRSLSRNRMLGIQATNDSVTGSSRRSSNDERLESSVKRRPLCANRDPVLDVSEDQEDDGRDANGDEEGVGDVGHGEVRNHRDKST
jgi:hypothetical protein